MKATLPLLVLGMILSSCAPSTPQTRIAQNPQKFASLTQKDQTLVQQGQIHRGMPPAAVELAWGPPHRRFEGSTNKQTTARWDYTGALPVVSSSFGGSYGYGPYSGRGRYRAYGITQEVTYIPYRMASVWFINNRVDAWERIR